MSSVGSDEFRRRVLSGREKANSPEVPAAPVKTQKEIEQEERNAKVAEIMGSFWNLTDEITKAARLQMIAPNRTVSLVHKSVFKKELEVLVRGWSLDVSHRPATKSGVDGMGRSDNLGRPEETVEIVLAANGELYRCSYPGKPSGEELELDYYPWSMDIVEGSGPYPDDLIRTAENFVSWHTRMLERFLIETPELHLD